MERDYKSEYYLLQKILEAKNLSINEKDKQLELLNEEIKYLKMELYQAQGGEI